MTFLWNLTEASTLNPTCQINKVKYTLCGFQCQWQGGSVSAVDGCAPLRLPEETCLSTPGCCVIPELLWRFQCKRVNQTPTNRTSTKSIGWGSAQYQENNLGNMSVKGVWLMLPHTLVCLSVPYMMFLHFCLTRNHCQVLIITSISTFSSFPPLSDAFLKSSQCKTTSFFQCSFSPSPCYNLSSDSFFRTAGIAGFKGMISGQ